ncbi:hypothetical protein pipiens_001161 [Culex pipiens pipiens]|uniref:Uncharacterized protein n=1 Tax=Culex pipiens pipiens TaxID=38569 RepID=A0ABD1DJ49_CULPP
MQISTDSTAHFLIGFSSFSKLCTVTMRKNRKQPFQQLLVGKPRPDNLQCTMARGISGTCKRMQLPTTSDAPPKASQHGKDDMINKAVDLTEFAGGRNFCS